MTPWPNGKAPDYGYIFLMFFNNFIRMLWNVFHNFIRMLWNVFVQQTEKVFILFKERLLLTLLIR